MVDRAHGTRRLYQLDPRGIGELRAYFDSFWTQALAAFKEAVEKGGRLMPTTDTAVRREITVNATPERAFEVFAERLDTWWPRVYSIGASDLAEVVIEPRRAAAGTSAGVDGTECVWGEVLAYDPPTPARPDLGASAATGRSTETASEIEVTFTPAGGGTRGRARPPPPRAPHRRRRAARRRSAATAAGAACSPATRKRCGLKAPARSDVDAVAQPAASRGPSSNTWPRWPPQRLQTTSVRIIPCEMSRLISTASATAGSVKLGQPDPDSNFVSSRNSSAPQPAQRYMPSSW